MRRTGAALAMVTALVSAACGGETVAGESQTASESSAIGETPTTGGESSETTRPTVTTTTTTTTTTIEVSGLPDIGAACDVLGEDRVSEALGSAFGPDPTPLNERGWAPAGGADKYAALTGAVATRCTFEAMNSSAEHKDTLVLSLTDTASPESAQSYVTGQLGQFAFTEVDLQHTDVARIGRMSSTSVGIDGFYTAILGSCGPRVVDALLYSAAEPTPGSLERLVEDATSAAC